MIRNYRFIVLSLSAVWLLVACGNPPTPEQVRERTSRIVRPLITDGAAAIEAITKHEMLAMIFGGMDDLLGGDDVIVAGEGSIKKQAEIDVEYDRSVTIDLTDGAEELARDLDEFLGEIFTADNIESEDGNTTTFLITGEMLCGESVDVRGSGGGPTTREYVEYEDEYDYYEGDDTGCDLAGLELRIDATLVGDGIDLEFRFGDTFGAVLALQLRPGSVKATVYLPALKKAATDVATLLEEELPEAFPSLLDGVLSVSVSEDGDALVAALSIDEALVVEGKADGDAYKADLPAARPLLSLRFEGAELSADVNWGAAEAILPAKAIFGDAMVKPLTEPLRVVLSSVRAKIKASADGKLALQKLIIDKASEVLLGETVLARVDVNAGQDLSMTVSPWNDLPRCELSSELSAKVELAAAELDPYMDSASPSWANETYELSLEADEQGPPIFVPLKLSGSDSEAVPPPCYGDECEMPQPEPVEPQNEARLQMLQGTLKLQSVNDPRSIEVVAGQCLVSVPDGEDGPFGGVAAGSCEPGY